jgi:hypothetical protein
VATIIHLVRRLEPSFSEELVRAGHRLFQASSLQQLLSLLRQHPHVDVILINDDVKEGRERAAALGPIAIILEKHASPNQVLREIRRLFPDPHKEPQ